ncbi:hypothetical protein P8452_48905 [Trifolium repens]|nr:hypothetical protein P8452_48905 [Trifolium repens]
MEIPLKKFLMYVLFLFAVVGAMIENVQGQFDCCTFERPCQPISCGRPPCPCPPPSMLPQLGFSLLKDFPTIEEDSVIFAVASQTPCSVAAKLQLPFMRISVCVRDKG